MNNYDLHDVRIHGINFELDDIGFPSIVFDVDVWEFDDFTNDAEGVDFLVQPSRLRYFGVGNFCMNINCSGDPFLIIDQCEILRNCDEFLTCIKLIDEGAFIRFSSTGNDMIPYGHKVRKKNVQYLNFHERVCRS